MNEDFFLFLAKGAEICLFDTYFVQKGICGYFSVKEFKLERALSFDSFVHRDDRQYVFSQVTVILRLKCMCLSLPTTFPDSLMV